MSYDFGSFMGKARLSDVSDLLKYRKSFRASNPDFFAPDGILLFSGGQGSGKTLSAARYVKRLSDVYPKALVVSNIRLNIPDRSIIRYTGFDALSKMDNGYLGIICFLDEIQVEFSSLESKKIHPSELSLISQQRKRRLHIVGTSQQFSRIAKPFREQCNALVECSSRFGGILQVNKMVDFGSLAYNEAGELTNVEYTHKTSFVRTPELFDLYDTFERVSSERG